MTDEVELQNVTYCLPPYEVEIDFTDNFLRPQRVQLTEHVARQLYEKLAEHYSAKSEE